MAWFLNLNKSREFRAERPLIIDKYAQPQVQFTFVDFIPAVIKRSTKSSTQSAKIEYHEFRYLLYFKILFYFQEKLKYK